MAQFGLHLIAKLVAIRGGVLGKDAAPNGCYRMNRAQRHRCNASQEIESCAVMLHMHERIHPTFSKVAFWMDGVMDSYRVR
jgi:hypothetical protein